MTPVLEFVGRGGPVMLAIIALSVALYSRCFKLLLGLRRSRRALVQNAANNDLDSLARLQGETYESFRQERLAVGAMIAAAPLLGLLGTVSGMVKMFESLGAHHGEQSMEGVARGISEVLVATESGLCVALPALLLVYLAHREVHRLAQQITAIRTGEGGAA